MPDKKIRKEDGLKTPGNEKNRIIKRNNKIKAVCIASSSCIALAAIGTVLGCGLRRHAISYECDGVDEVWLSTHEFDTSSYQTSFSEFGGVELKTPSIPGYSFVGWYLKDGNKALTEEKYKGNIFSNEDVTLIAKFEPITYTVTLNLLGGTLTELDNGMYQGHKYISSDDGNTYSTTYICIDEPFNLPLASKKGYNFASSGWLDAGDQYYNSINCKTLLENKTLNADWTIRPYNIKYNFVGDCVDEFIDDPLYPLVNNNIKSSDIEHDWALVEPYLKGYNFIGWFDKNDQKVTRIPLGLYSDNDLIEYTGKFEPIVYSITYHDYTKSNLSSMPKTYTRASADLAIPDIEPFGYTFLGWLSDTTGAIRQHVSEIKHGSTGDIEFTADYKINNYSITYKTTGISETSPIEVDYGEDHPLTYTVEDDVVISDPTADGYKFIGWTFAGQTNPIKELYWNKFTKAEDMELTANFEIITYKITYRYNTNTHGDDTVKEKTYTVETEEFTLVTPESTKKTFVAWEDVESTSKTRYKADHKFGGGSFGNMVLKAIWSFNGKGTSDSPFEIYDEYQLAEITDGYYKLMDDITISPAVGTFWNPIGSADSKFNGTFDGNGHCITFQLNSNNASGNIGLFGYCGSNSVLKNVAIKGSVGAFDSRVAVTKYGALAISTSGLVESCTSQVSAHLTSNDEGEAYIGGLIGYLDAGRVQNSVFGLSGTGIVDFNSTTIRTAYVGGLCGYGNGGEILDCGCFANVYSKANQVSYAGGLLGLRNPNYTTRIAASTIDNAKLVTGSISSETVVDGGLGSDAMFIWKSSDNTSHRELGYSLVQPEDKPNPIERVDGYYYFMVTNYGDPYPNIYYMMWYQWDGANQKYIVVESLMTYVVYFGTI